ncbi:MAG: hypothetical protein AAF235_05555 [Planctomycetota bacterium]
MGCIREYLLIAAAAFVCHPSTARELGAIHPQDGPHADLRLAVEPDGVRFSIGLNLAFIDTAVSVMREADTAVTQGEADAILVSLERHLRENAVVRINGERVEPVVETTHMFIDPDPGMIALYPKMGMRALIRGVALLWYPSSVVPESLEVTWPTYPVDQLALDFEGPTGPDGQGPRMVLEGLLQAEGKDKLVRWSEAQTTISWQTGDMDPESMFKPVPEPPSDAVASATDAGGISVTSGIFLVLGGVALVVAFRRATSPAGASHPPVFRPVGAAIACGLVAYSARDVTRVTTPWASTIADQAAAPADADTVFSALHANLYTAFDFTDESDIYDALDRSVGGGLLEELYGQVRGSLIQAEQGGKLGLVTDVRPLSTAITPASPREMEASRADRDAPADRSSPRFIATHTWQVDGTVYHWGHSHTRTHEYQAAYGVSVVDGAWKITDQQMLSQTRLDVDDTPAIPAQDEIDALLRDLGGIEF